MEGGESSCALGTRCKGVLIGTTWSSRSNKVRYAIVYLTNKEIRIQQKHPWLKWQILRYWTTPWPADHFRLPRGRLWGFSCRRMQSMKRERTMEGRNVLVTIMCLRLSSKLLLWYVGSYSYSKVLCLIKWFWNKTTHNILQLCTLSTNVLRGKYIPCQS